MADPFAGMSGGMESPATRHFSITPANTDLPILPRSLFVVSAGDLVMRDADGVDVTYPVIAGAVVAFRAVQVRVGTTAGVVGWY